ncbi:ash family protein [Methylovulum psychrotolerans]|nr:ash family protein [Methylovulum psychrotolerans]
MNMTIIHPLTGNHSHLMLCPPSKKTEAGIRTPRKGHNRPQSHVVFLCPPKTRAAFCRARSVMVGCIEQPVKRLACAFAGSANLTHPTAQRLALFGGGLSPFKGKPQ